MNTFDFWYLGIQNILAFLCLAIMTYDARSLTIISGIFVYFWVFLIDASPKMIRKYTIPIILSLLSSGLLGILCVHFNYLKNFQNFSFTIGDVEWNTKQIFTSCLLVLIVYLIRYLIYTKFYPNKFLFLTINLERGGYKKRFLH